MVNYPTLFHWSKYKHRAWKTRLDENQDNENLLKHTKDVLSCRGMHADLNSCDFYDFDDFQGY